MFADFYGELSGRGLATLLGLVIGMIVTALIARWHRMKEHRKILAGDARDTVTIHLHLVEPVDMVDAKDPSRLTRKAGTLRIRTLGQGELARVVPNAHLGAVLRHRAVRVTTRDTLISMEGAEGSYLLETLTGFVCDRATNAPFEHDLYVMAPCCEPQQLAQHQPITVLLISVADLALFESWPITKKVRVEHGTDGARILT